MASADFHRKPFDEGTLTKLQIFELYAREWLPVFLSPEKPPRPEIHIFDFFAGPGTDSLGELGSPLRLLRQLKDYQDMAGWPHVRIHAHFSDSSQSKIKQLEANIDSRISTAHSAFLMAKTSRAGVRSPVQLMRLGASRKRNVNPSF